MARKGALTSIWRFGEPEENDDIEWTLIFSGQGSLDFRADGSLQWDPNGDLDWSDDPDMEKVWSR